MSATGAAGRRIAVVADDLIWATRLADGVRRAGAEPVPLRTSAAVEAELARPAGPGAHAEPGDPPGSSPTPRVDGAIVDLSARGYEPLAVLRVATAAGVAAIAVGPHDDAALRQAARDAGAARVHPYRALFERGDEVLGAWLASLGPGPSPVPSPVPSSGASRDATPDAAKATAGAGTEPR